LHFGPREHRTQDPKARLVQSELERRRDDLAPEVAHQSCRRVLADIDRSHQQPIALGVADPVHERRVLHSTDETHGHLLVQPDTWAPSRRRERQVVESEEDAYQLGAADRQGVGRTSGKINS
jgi:hypothetical protein